MGIRTTTYSTVSLQATNKLRVMGFLDTLKHMRQDACSSDASTLAGSRPTSVSDKTREPQITLQSLRSASHEGHPSGELEKTPAEESQNEEDDDDESQYPTKLKLMLIVISLCLSVFCLALDNTIIATAIPKVSFRVGSTLELYLTCPTDHRSIQSHQRCRLDRKQLPSDYLRFPVARRQAVHLLQSQMGLPRRHRHL